MPLIFSNADSWRRRLKLGFGCMTPLKEGWGENREFVRFMRKMQSAIALKNATTADRVGTDMQKELKKKREHIFWAKKRVNLSIFINDELR